MSNVKICIRDYWGNEATIPFKNLLRAGTIQVEGIHDEDGLTGIPWGSSEYKDNLGDKSGGASINYVKSPNPHNTNSYNNTLEYYKINPNFNEFTQNKLITQNSTHPVTQTTLFNAVRANSAFYYVFPNVPSNPNISTEYHHKSILELFVDPPNKHVGYICRNFPQEAEININAMTSSHIIQEKFKTNFTEGTLKFKNYTYTLDGFFPVDSSAPLTLNRDYSKDLEDNVICWDTFASGPVVFRTIEKIIPSPGNNPLDAPSLYINMGVTLSAPSMLHPNTEGVYRHLLNYINREYAQIPFVIIYPEYSYDFSDTVVVTENINSKPPILSINLLDKSWSLNLINLNFSGYSQISQNYPNPINYEDEDKTVSYNSPKDLVNCVSSGVFKTSAGTDIVIEDYDVMVVLPSHMRVCNHLSSYNLNYIERSVLDIPPYKNGLVNLFYTGTVEHIEHTKALFASLNELNPLFRGSSAKKTLFLSDTTLSPAPGSVEHKSTLLGSSFYLCPTVSYVFPYTTEVTLILRHKVSKDITKKTLKIVNNSTMPSYINSLAGSEYNMFTEQSPNLPFTRIFRKKLKEGTDPDSPNGYYYQLTTKYSGVFSYSPRKAEIGDGVFSYEEYEYKSTTSSSTYYTKFKIAPLGIFHPNLKKVKHTVAMGEYSNGASSKAPLLEEEHEYYPIPTNRVIVLPYTNQGNRYTFYYDSLGVFYNTSGGQTSNSLGDTRDLPVPYDFFSTSSFYNFNNKEFYVRGYNLYNTFNTSLILTLFPNGAIGVTSPQGGYTGAYIKYATSSNFTNILQNIAEHTPYVQSVWVTDNLKYDSSDFSIKVKITPDGPSDFREITNIPMDTWISFDSSSDPYFYILTNSHKDNPNPYPQFGKHRVKVDLTVKNNVLNTQEFKIFYLYIDCTDVEYELVSSIPDSW